MKAELITVAFGFLAVLSWQASASAGDEMAQKSLNSKLMAAEAAPSKEFTAGCVNAPFPLQPVGPTFASTYTYSREVADVVIWRTPCGVARAEAQTLVTFSPRVGTPFVCSGSVILIQGGVQFDSIFLSRTSGTSIDSLCNDLLVPVTAYFRPSRTTAVAFDDDAAFTMIIPADSSGPGLRLEVPAYNPALYGGASPTFSIKPGMSGAWNTASIGNQGWFFDINENGRVFTVAWFTGTQDGAGLDWYSAVGSYSGDTVSTTLYRTTGVSFARPTTVNTNPFGTLSFDFESCSSGVVNWSMNDGRIGSLPIQKLLPAGVGC